MSAYEDSREGLSPPPNILDLFAGDGDGDSDVDFHPSEEQSATEASGVQDDDSSDTDFIGNNMKLSHMRSQTG
jgi:hypothetical protein